MTEKPVWLKGIAFGSSRALHMLGVIRGAVPPSFSLPNVFRAAPSPNAGWVHQQLMIKVLCLSRRVFQLSERLKHLKRTEDWKEGAQGLLKRRKERSQKATMAPYHGMEIQRFPVLPGTGDSHYLYVFCKMRS